ncbi:MAG: DUF3299 domain-containing protein [Hyphomicrobiales bacterium]|nr:DUF3299 domain-containing protein [Hyphomicrobiales bacterium]
MTVFFVTQVIAKPVELDWDALIPDEGKGAVVAIPKNGTIVGALKKEDYSDLTKEEFEDTVLYYEEQREDQSKSISIRTDLHGKSIRIAGYVTPVEIDGDNVTGFLLVPYIGACVHVPAPPGNQMVYISGAKKLKLDDIYDPIWVTGKLQARPLTTLYAQVGYQIADPEIQPYD